MNRESAPPKSRVPARVVWPVVATLSAVMLLIRLAFELSEQLAARGELAVGRALFEEVVGAIVAVPYIYVAIQAMRRWPFDHADRWRWGLRLTVLFVAVSLVHAPVLYAVRWGAGEVMGVSGYSLVPSLPQIVHEAVNAILPALATIAGMTAAESVLQSRDRERQAFALERSLLEAELQNMRLQLQPHFLFNALNTIAATMYDDVDAADRQLTQLSDLLRASLRSTNAQEVPLRDEVALVEQYVGLMQARFPGALRWEVELEAGTHDLLVPSMSLQPLVENAVRHGGLSQRGSGEVRLSARIVATPPDAPAADATLQLIVHDDGPGMTPGGDALARGTGLSATARRVSLLYGDRGSLAAGNAAGGGFESILSIPVTRGASPQRGDGDDVPARVGIAARRIESSRSAVS